MNARMWTPDDTAEYEAACAEAWSSSDRQDERNDRFIQILEDARQAHRGWARDVMDEALRIGSASKLKTWAKRQVVAMSRNGRVLSKPRVIGVRKRDADGRDYTQQGLFDFFTVDELQGKRREYLTQIGAYDDNLALVDRLIDLCEAAGEVTPAAAAKKLGTTVEEWLAS